MESIKHKGGTMFDVASESDKDMSYSIDLAICLCSCPSGNTGAICKHQIACYQYSAVHLSQDFSLSVEDRKAWTRIVYVDRDIPNLCFFQDLKKSGDTPENKSVILVATTYR